MPDSTDNTSTPSANAAEQTAQVQNPPATYRDTRIRQLEQERDDLREAIHTVLTSGKSYTLSNSHSVTRADVADLQSRLSAVNQELRDLMVRRPYQPLRRESTKFY